MGTRVKRSKVSTSGVRWEWEGDGGKWSQYSSEHSQSLSDALISGCSDVTLQVSEHVKLKIDFDSMTQRNVKTGWQRSVRCADSNSSSPKTESVWEWENESGEWVWFSPGHQRLLDACVACKVATVSVELSSGKQSTVDLKLMKHEMPDGKKLGTRCTSLAGQRAVILCIHSAYLHPPLFLSLYSSPDHTPCIVHTDTLCLCLPVHPSVSLSLFTLHTHTHTHTLSLSLSPLSLSPPPPLSLSLSLSLSPLTHTHTLIPLTSVGMAE